MTFKEFSLEKIDNLINRLSITSIRLDTDYYFFEEIFNFLFNKGEEIIIFGQRKNLYWKNKNEIDILEKLIKTNFTRHNFSVLYEKGESAIFSVLKLEHYDASEIQKLIDCLNYFEFVFILKIKNENVITQLSQQKAFSFDIYKELLKEGAIVFSICKLDNETIAIDSNDLNLLSKFSKSMGL